MPDSRRDMPEIDCDYSEVIDPLREIVIPVLNSEFNTGHPRHCINVSYRDHATFFGLLITLRNDTQWEGHDFTAIFAAIHRFEHYIGEKVGVAFVRG